ncbi:hypothetical protein BC938DRAFT_472858 [Jimgerdemannia flammicorona]|uniref:Oxidoreductase N-terminal domain-containing protein n=1 Tax=Jimgerdemannia flammicorona TaxID=994334 RepID=A0A433QZS9_9FUNG|nr:hypothetical protein BC938DRAFT_472858 [Jimgerdemannia flammicorona]
MSATTNTQVLFRKVPTTFPVNGEHVEVVKTPFSLEAIELADGDFVLKNLVLSVDPPSKSYTAAFPIDSALTGNGVSVVLKSKNDKFPVGNLVTA